MTKPYLKPTDPEAFTDMEVKDGPEDVAQAADRLCPKCQGHGGWNLRLNAYPLPKGKEDTPANRNRYCHFRASCGPCNGYGYLSPGQVYCDHEWKFVLNLGRCFNRYMCTKCNQVNDVDSSD